MRTQRSGIPLTFVVRVSRDRDRQLRGTVERVKTGEKRRFQDSDDIGNLIAQMVAGEDNGEKGGR